MEIILRSSTITLPLLGTFKDTTHGAAMSAVNTPACKERNSKQFHHELQMLCCGLWLGVKQDPTLPTNHAFDNFVYIIIFSIAYYSVVGVII